MFPHLSASGIDLAKSIISFATALLSFAALLKKVRFSVPLFKKTLFS
jgi:hypothetical protein